MPDPIEGRIRGQDILVPTPDNSALDEHGQLKDASEIKWYNSASDEEPIAGDLQAPPPPNEVDAPAIVASASEDPAVGPSVPRRSLKGKQPAQRVAGTRTRKVSWKVTDNPETDRLGIKAFFASRGEASQSTASGVRATTSRPSTEASGSRRPRQASSTRTKTSAVAATEPGSKPSTPATTPPPSSLPSTRASTPKRARSPTTASSNSEEDQTDVEPPKKRRNRGKKRAKRRGERLPALADPGDDSDGEDDPVAEYEATRKQRAKERANSRRRRSTRGKDDRTTDVRLVFTKDEQDGQSGHWCEVCKVLNVRLADCWLTGSVSTLRAHVGRRFATHGEVYLTKCKQAGIERVLQEAGSAAEEEGAAKHDKGQQKLDSFLKKDEQWTKEGLLDHIVELVVTDDQAFSLIDKAAFRC